MPAEIIELSKGADGRWVTINGVHVHIGAGGTIDKGPAHFQGKTPDQVEDHETGTPLLHKSGHAARKVEHAMKGGAEHHAKAVEELEHMDAADVIDAAKEHGIKGVSSKPKAIAAIREHLAASKPAEPAKPSADKFEPGRTAYTDLATGEQRFHVQAKVKGERVYWSEDAQGNRLTPARPYDANAVRHILEPGEGLLGGGGGGAIDKSDPPKRKSHMSRIYLSAGDAGPLTPALTLGQGFPTHEEMIVGGEKRNVPLAYFWKDAIRAGDYVHPATKQKLSVDAARIDGWVSRFAAMRKAGIEIPTPRNHKAGAENNLGWVIDARRDGDTLKLLHKAIGEDAAMEALRNRCSLCIEPDYTDEKGHKWGDVFTHNAYTPNPVVTGMGQFVPFVASRDGEDGTPIYYLSADDGGSEMELTKELRLALGVAADVPDDKLIDGVKLLRATHDAQATKITELSRTPAAPDPEILRDRAELTLGRIELAVSNGDLPPTIASKLKARVLKDGKPNVFQLSRNDGLDARPIDDVLDLFKGEKLNPATGSQTNAQGVRLARETPGGEASDAEKAEQKSADDEVARMKKERGVA